MHSNRNSCFCIFLSLLRMCWHFYSLLFILVKSYDLEKWSMAQICGCRYFSFKHDTISVWKMWHSSNYEMYDLQQTSICLYQLIIIHANQDFGVDVNEMFNVNLNTRANMNVGVIKFYDFRRVIFMLFREFNICAMYVRKIHLNCIMAFQIIRSIQKINVFKRIFLG